MPGRPTIRRRVAAAAVTLAALAGMCAAAPGATASPATAPPVIDLGSGFVRLSSPASEWLAANPRDPRAGRIGTEIVSQPAALWLTGPESYGNLDTAVRAARQADGTIVLVLYDIPGRYDGLTDPSPTTAGQYREFVDHVATTLGSTRAAVVVEPDALWFVDRMTPPGTAAYRERMSSLKYAVDTFARVAPGSRLYLDAGTSSGSVTPARMAQLLVAAGVARTGGFAVNVSSFAPSGELEPYAQAIRTELRTAYRIADPRYVADTSRNGNPSWDGTWCNPSRRLIGVPPALYSDSTGLDATLWVKQPGTSDGDCGNGRGSYGGQFLPDVAYAQAR